MFNKYKLTLILASLVILLPIPVQLLLGRQWSMILAIPLMLLAVFWLCIFFTLKDDQNKDQNPKPFLIVFWVIPILSILICAMDYCFTNGVDFNMERLLCQFFGALFLAIGNYLPKVRRNYTYGIKLPWTYSSDENWNATHRFGGKVWFFCGLGILLTSFLPEMLCFYALIFFLLVAVIAPTVYSCLFYRKQKEAGAALEPMPILPGKSAKTSLIFLAAVALFVACILFTGNLEYHYGDTSFTVEASFYDELTVNYADIKDVKYLDHNMEGRRVWGYGSLRLLLGTFETEGFQYTRYTYYDPQSAVGVMLEDQIIILSGRDPEESKQIYETLLEKCALE